MPTDLTANLTEVYDAWNRLTAVKDGANFVARYAYDGLTRRVVKQAYDSGGTLTETRHYYFSDQWQIVREMVSGSTAALYIWDLRYIDELLVRYDLTFGRKYAMQDANFNCTAICDDASTGTVDERYQYDPYAGNRVILDSSWNVISASAYNWTVGHQGLMFETEVGIYNCRNRVYLPKMGTWMQRDPLGYADGGNLYEYVGSNPVVFQDQSGTSHIYGDCASRAEQWIGSREVCHSHNAQVQNCCQQAKTMYFNLCRALSGSIEKAESISTRLLQNCIQLVNVPGLAPICPSPSLPPAPWGCTLCMFTLGVSVAAFCLAGGICATLTGPIGVPCWVIISACFGGGGTLVIARRACKLLGAC